MTEYADIAALNWSSLKHMAESPLAYRWHLAHPREDTPALRLGRAVHARILEPAEYERRWAVAPQCDRRTKAGRAEWDEWLEW